MDQAVTPPAVKKKGAKSNGRAPSATRKAAREGGCPRQGGLAQVRTRSRRCRPTRAEARSRQVLAALTVLRQRRLRGAAAAGLAGRAKARIAEAFNQSIANAERITAEAARLCTTRRQGRPPDAADVRAGRAGRLGGPGRLAQHADRRPGAARPPTSPAPSAPWPRATWASRWTCRSTAAPLEGRVPALGQAGEHA